MTALETPNPTSPWRIAVPELVFLGVLTIGLTAGSSYLYNDPGTFWHVRLGRQILDSGAVPRFDSLTYTRLQTPWVDQSWLFDAGLAWVVRHLGWSAASTLAALLFAAVYASLARWLLQTGANPLSALLTTILAVAIGSIHFLIRPHIFTYLFIFWTLKTCRDYHVRKDWRIWLTPAVVALWANLHGGFLAGPFTVAVAALGEAVSGPLDAPRLRKLAVLALVAGLSAASALINPYGLDLYRHVFHLLLDSGVTQIISEYHSAPFGEAEAQVLEWVILALVALPAFSRNRADRYDLVPALAWMHMALGSIRHAPFFAMAAAPLLARLLDGMLTPEPEPRPRLAPRSAWIPLVSAAVLLALLLGAPIAPRNTHKWPFAALPALNRQPLSARLFHEQDWGGFIELETRPRRLAYVDDRFELWGKQPILDYIAALQGGPAWDQIEQSQHIGLVWIKPDRPLARRLSADPDWETIYEDKLSVLFARRIPETLTASGD